MSPLVNPDHPRNMTESAFRRYGKLVHYESLFTQAFDCLNFLGYPGDNYNEPSEDDRYAQMCERAIKALAPVLRLLRHDIATNPGEWYDKVTK